MAHLPQIIQDLALILVVAAAVSLAFKKLRQPVVLGYLVAGMLVGPHQDWFPTVIDHAGINIWAEIGVIFLLFAIGLEFSFRKLMSVGGSAGITAAVQVCLMLALGYIAGRAVGWDWMNSLFLGAVISISSTTILIKTFEELGLKGRRFVSLVVGILIFEDLAAVLLLVLLSTMAITREFHGVQLIGQVTRLMFFLCLWFMVGVFILPNLVKRLRVLLNAEATLIVSLGLCFLMVVLATKAGFSPALGAFIMGSLLSETSEGERIVKVTSSVKDLFSAIFFVSVGMLIDPQILIREWDLVVFFTLVVVLGKIFSVTFGALISGQNLKTSLQSGLSLAQIGEFSYIIAGLGLSLKVTNELLYPLAVAISVVTAFITPYMVRGADGIYSVVEKIVPRRMRKALDSYSLLPGNGAPLATRREYLRNFSLKMLLNTVVIIAIFLAMSEGVLPWLQTRITPEFWLTGALLVATFLMAAPFLWALVFSQVEGYSFAVIWRNRAVRTSVLFLSMFRLLWGMVLVAALLGQFIPEAFYVLLSLLAMTIFVLLLYSRIERVYGAIEGRFLSNLHRKGQEEKELQVKKAAGFEMPPLAPWDAHMVEFVVPPEANYVGVPLQKLSIRQRYGVIIALIRRGGKRITAPGKHEMLMPLDRIFVIGSDEQLLKFKFFLDSEKLVEDPNTQRDYSLEPFMVKPDCTLVGKPIRLSGLREATQGMLVGLERNGQRLLNPDTNIAIQPGDLLWIVGDRRLIRNLT